MTRERRDWKRKVILQGVVSGATLFWLLAGTSTMATARAYCRESTCDMSAQPCAVDAHGCQVEGKQLSWPAGMLSMGISSRASRLRGISQAQLGQLVTKALGTWASATCPGGGHPSIHAEVLLLTAGMIEFDPTGANDNVVELLDSAWPYEASSVGKTLLAFDQDTGEMLDADIALNSAKYPFVTSGDGIDLVAVLTHEVGHALGLAHSDVAGATMQPETRGFGTSELRSLESDDRAGICAIYPPTHDPVSKPAGSAATGSAAPSNAGCSVVRARGATPAYFGSLAAGLIFVVCVRRARCREHRARGSWRLRATSVAIR